MVVLRVISLVITGCFAIAGSLLFVNIPKTVSFYKNLEVGNLQVDSVYLKGSISHRSKYLRGIILLPNEATPISRSSKFSLYYGKEVQEHLLSRRIDSVGLKEVNKGGKPRHEVDIEYTRAAPARKEQLLIPCWFNRVHKNVALRLTEEQPDGKKQIQASLWNAILLVAPFVLTLLFWWVRKRRLAKGE